MRPLFFIPSLLSPRSAMTCVASAAPRARSFPFFRKQTQATNVPMDPVRIICLLRGCLGAASLFAASAAFGQSASPPSVSPASPAAEEDEPVSLSPFVVKAEADQGYVATNSLAGTRLKTPLKDIAAS